MTDQEQTPTDQLQYWQEKFNTLLELTLELRKLQREGDLYELTEEQIDAERKFDKDLERMEKTLESNK